MRVIAVVAMLAGCGRLGFDERSLPPVPDGAGSDDADDDPARCAYGALVRPPELRSAHEDWEPTVSPDGQNLVFNSDRDGDGDQLFVSMLLEDGVTWAPPAKLDVLNALNATSFGASWAPGGRRLYFASTRGDVSRAYVAAFDGNFHAPQLVPGLEDVDAGSVEISHSELELFITTPAALPELPELIVATRDSVDGAFTVQGRVPGLDTTGIGNGWPTFTRSDLTMYFERSTADTPSDVYVAHRPAVGEPFGAASRVGPLDSVKSEDGDPELALDGTVMVFASNRDSVAEDSDIYFVSRTCN